MAVTRWPALSLVDFPIQLREIGKRPRNVIYGKQTLGDAIAHPCRLSTASRASSIGFAMIAAQVGQRSGDRGQRKLYRGRGGGHIRDRYLD
jgi:hypothetical protein